jgi:enoyl-CoA hydratase
MGSRIVHNGVLAEWSRGEVVHLQLQRPKALNSLNQDLINALIAALLSHVRGVVVLRADRTSRAFCSGGDVRTLAEYAASSQRARVHRYFLTEFQMDLLVREMSLQRPVRTVALLNGIAMGGGLGLTWGCTVRVGTDKSVFAMPEINIGFLTDVGSTYYMARMPRCLGMYMSLTAARLGSADALHVGILTHYVPSSAYDLFLTELDACAHWADVDASLRRYARPAPPSPLAAAAADIEAVFSADSVEEILLRLDAMRSSQWARETMQAMLKASPRSLKVCHEAVRRAASLSLEECFRMEMRVAYRLAQERDFVNGVEGVLVKRQAPIWQHNKASDVPREKVLSYFLPYESADMEFRPLPIPSGASSVVAKL